MIDRYRRWWRNAACAGKPLGLFFSDKETPPVPGWRLHQGARDSASYDWTEAERLCASCPVLRECERDTLGEEYGFWGGRTSYQRAVLRNERSRNVRDLPDSEKEEIAGLVISMRKQSMDWVYVSRTVGLTPPACRWLIAWHKEMHPDPNAVIREPGWRNVTAVTTTERARMAHLHDLGVPPEEIALRLGRARDTVVRHLRKERRNRAKQPA